MNLSCYLGQCKKNKVTNLRKLTLDGSIVNDYIHDLRFKNFEDVDNDDIIKKLEEVRIHLNKSEINGKNEIEPFFREITNDIDDFNRIEDISKKLRNDLPIATSIDHMSFVLIQYEEDKVIYRFFVKMLRNQSMHSNYSLKNSGCIQKKICIESHKNEKRKSLPTTICYAEKIGINDYFQYVFDVNDYEKIFGINNIKSENCRNKLKQFQKSHILFNGYKVIFDKQLTDEVIIKFLKKHRRCTNALYRYNDEAKDYDINNIKEALKYAEEFGQEAFSINKQEKTIFIASLKSLEALISIITNKKKLAIASNDIEDGIATKKKNKSENNIISLMDNLNIKEGNDNG